MTSKHLILFLALIFQLSAQKISDEVFHTATRDSSGIVWFGGLNKIARYNGHDPEVFRFDPKEDNNLFKGFFHQIIPCKNQIYFIADDKILVYINQINNFKVLLDSIDININSVSIYDDSNILIGTNKNLLIYSIYNNRIDTLIKNKVEKLSNLDKNTFYFRKNERVFKLDLEYTNIIRLDSLPDSIVDYHILSNDQIILQSKRFLFINKEKIEIDSISMPFLIYKMGQYYSYSTNNGDLIKFDMNLKFQEYRRDNANLYKQFLYYYVDKYNTSWLLTYKGVFKVNFNDEFKQIYHTNRYIYKSFNVDQKFYISMFKDGLAEFKDNKVNFIDSPIHLVNDVIKIDGKVYFAGVNNGIIVRENKNYYQYPYIKDKIILSLEYSNNRLWIGTTNGVFEIESGNIKRIINSDKYSNFKNEEVHDLKTLNKDELWIGTNTGLYIYNVSLKKFVKNQNQFIRAKIGSIKFHNNKVYILTTGGVLILDPNSKQLIDQINSTNGLIGNQINDMLVSNDTLYFGTDQGLSIFDKNHNLIKSYSKNDKINNVQSIHKMNNSIYFTTSKKIVKIIKNKKRILKPPKIVMTKISKFDHNIEFGTNFNEVKELILSHNENYISFEFSILNEIDHQKVRYKYRIRNEYKKWRVLGNTNVISFSSMEPKTYILEIMGYNSEGTKTLKPKRIKIIVHPPLYKTWQAYLGYFLILFLIGYLIYKRTLDRKLLKFNSEKEKFEIKNRIAKDLHDEIGANLSSIAHLSKNLIDNGHSDATKSKINSITNITHTSIHSMRDIIWFIDPTNNDLEKFWGKIKETTFNMIQDFDYDMHIDDDIHVDENLLIRKNLYLFYKECLQNILKHAQASEVSIKFTNNDDHFNMEVRDNGVGFDVDHHSNGHGLQNLSTRANFLKGEISITSQPNIGTHIKLKIPHSRYMTDIV